jgi:hypothetical protein
VEWQVQASDRDSAAGRRQAPDAVQETKTTIGVTQMARRRDLTIENASSLPLPPPSLASGEDAAGYDELAGRIATAVAPENVIEEIWVRDVVDLVWDVVRLRRLKAGLFRVGAGDGMAEIMRGLGDFAIKGRDWAARKPAAVMAVNAQLSAAGLDMSDVFTSTFAARIDQFERIERMLAAAEVRRAAALDAIENRRVAERLRTAALEAERAAAPPVEEGEFTLVSAGAADAAPRRAPA